MPNKASNPHDEQTSAAAESLRAILNHPTFRGGNTQADWEKLRKRLEGVAQNLDEQGKTPEEIKEMREEQGLPDPNKTAAELVRESLDHDNVKSTRSVSSPGVPIPDNKVDLGKPVIPSQATTTARDAQEKAAKEADKKIADAGKK